MAKPIKLFQPLEKVYQSLGIRRYQPKLRDRVSPKCIFLLMAMAIYFTSSLVFCVSGAKSVAERGDSFYIVATQIALMYLIILYIREVPGMHQFTGKFENLFQQSKLTFSKFQNWWSIQLLKAKKN